MPSAKIGQHFLTNRAIAEKIVKSFLPGEGAILEIGPGKGVLTELLILNYPRHPLVAVELDTALAEHLKQKYSGVLRVVEQNVLRVRIDDLFLGDQENVNLISNVPYYISKDLIDWIFLQGDKITRGILMMQKEFVDKLLYKGPGRESNAQALLFNWMFRAEKVFDVQPGAFSPPPTVRSSVFVFQRNQPVCETEIDPGKFYKFLKVCFINRRKTLLNNLSSLYDVSGMKEIFNIKGLDSKIRSEQLKLDDLLWLYQQLKL